MSQRKEKQNFSSGEWFCASIFWLGLILLAFHPRFASSFFGRLAHKLFMPLLVIHLGEGLLAFLLSLKKGLSPWGWLVKGMYFGLLGWTKLL